jgi:ribosomal protein S18 acetylase RimI-like enzyme
MPLTDISIRSLTEADVTALSALLIETVAQGGSVSFMHPLQPADAIEFWQNSLASAANGKRVVLGAFDKELLVGTVTLLIDCPPNQPHRAEIAKMMTAVSHRGKGIARMLLRQAEHTAEEEGAAGFYEKLGYQRVGLIPDYALKPHGGLTGTIIYYKRLD